MIMIDICPCVYLLAERERDSARPRGTVTIHRNVSCNGCTTKFLCHLCRTILGVPFTYVSLERRLASWEQQTWLEHGIEMSGSRKEMHGIF